MTNTWTEFTTGLAMIWDTVVTSIRQVWNNVISWIAKATLWLGGLVRSTLDVLEEIDAPGLASKLKEKLSFDVNGAVGVVEEDRQRFNRGLGVARQERDQQRVAEMQQRLAETEQGSGSCELHGKKRLVERKNSKTGKPRTRHWRRRWRNSKRRLVKETGVP